MPEAAAAAAIAAAASSSSERWRWRWGNGRPQQQHRPVAAAGARLRNGRHEPRLQLLLCRRVMAAATAAAIIVARMSWQLFSGLSSRRERSPQTGIGRLAAFVWLQQAAVAPGGGRVGDASPENHSRQIMLPVVALLLPWLTAAGVRRLVVAQQTTYCLCVRGWLCTGTAWCVCACGCVVHQCSAC